MTKSERNPKVEYRKERAGESLRNPPVWTYALFLSLFFAANLSAAEGLRVFIRAGAKTHGPNQHDHPRILEEWKKLLAERGLKAVGALDFPSAAQLENTDGRL